MLSILSKQLFINICSVSLMVIVVSQVLVPYNKTISTFVLKFLTLLLVGTCLKFQILSNCTSYDIEVTAFLISFQSFLMVVSSNKSFKSCNLLGSGREAVLNFRNSV